MYRWYGDKKGLFLAMVRGNAAAVSQQIAGLQAHDTPPLEMFKLRAPVLLGVLTGDRAIALNRAAASDASGALGQSIDAGGRADVLPVVQQIIVAARRHIRPLFMHLLVGDRQIRRVIGTLPAPTLAEVTEQAQVAMAQFVACARPERQ